MADVETINRLEQLAAWHRINADRAGADWVWEARLRTAEDLERQAAELRLRLPATADVATAAVINGPATKALKAYEVQETTGTLQIRVCPQATRVA